MKEPWSVHAQRIVMGILAGFTANLAKSYSQTGGNLIEFFMAHKGDDLVVYMYAFATGIVILCFLGGIGAWLSSETLWRKMFVVGLSAPALIAAAIPEHKPGPTTAPIRTSWIEYVSPISLAHAAGDDDDDCVGDIALVKGVKMFFGVQDDRADKYSVAIGSVKDKSNAQAKVRAFNSANTAIKARLGKRSCSSDFYPIIVGDPAPLESAKKLLEKANEAASINDGFLIPGAR